MSPRTLSGVQTVLYSIVLAIFILFRLTTLSRPWMPGQARHDNSCGYSSCKPSRAFIPALALRAVIYRAAGPGSRPG